MARDFDGIHNAVSDTTEFVRKRRTRKHPNKKGKATKLAGEGNKLEIKGEQTDKSGKTTMKDHWLSVSELQRQLRQTQVTPVEQRKVKGTNTQGRSIRQNDRW